MNIFNKIIKRFFIGPKPGDIYIERTPFSHPFNPHLKDIVIVKIVDRYDNIVQIEYLTNDMSGAYYEWNIDIFNLGFKYRGKSDE